eukprot:maker-scaffold_3-snap-gene-5.8-mRNA-1 protein AED:0.01 eAED:0.01 QI:94/0.66/0.75/1/1/1/4/99/325
MSFKNLLEDIERAVENSNVIIRKESIRKFCDRIHANDISTEIKDSQVNSSVEKSKKGLIYLAYNAVNFSFFPDANTKRWFISHEGKRVGADDEAHAIVAALKDFDVTNPGKLSDPTFLRSLNFETPDKDAGELPMLDERLNCLRSLGDFFETLQQKTDIEDPIESLSSLCQGSCVNFVNILCEMCPIFNDTFEYKGKKIRFAKRPQLCCAMFHSDEIIKFQDIEKLTIFADYRLPQILRKFEILTFPAETIRKIDEEVYFASGKEDEIEIRAATILAGELIVQELRARGIQVLAKDIDYYLWRTAVEMDAAGELPTFHRCRSIFY